MTFKQLLSVVSQETYLYIYTNLGTSGQVLRWSSWPHRVPRELRDLRVRFVQIQDSESLAIELEGYPNV